ncbi:MAG: carbamoyl phosphate synthase large subunit, partial [Bacteroidales bacterium]|nr:carbamoyl phosphate synthase large subunit [Bacteroidales bacterium]
IPEKNILLSTGPIEDKVAILDAVKLLAEKGYKIFATKGTQEFLAKNEVEATALHWPDEDKKPNTLDYLREKKIDLVINIPKNLSATELNNDYLIRRNAVDYNIPLITNSRLAKAFIIAICKMKIDDIAIKSWDEYN